MRRLFFFILFTISFTCVGQNIPDENVIITVVAPPLPEPIKYPIIEEESSKEYFEEKEENIYDEVFTHVETSPEFPGGLDNLILYLQHNIRYPKGSNVEGRVVIKFTIDIEGNIKNVKVVKKLTPECDKEAHRVIKNMPKWKPGTVNGKPVNCYYVCPIIFRNK